MPFVSGFLRLRRRGHPDIGLPGPEGEVDPDYGIDEGAGIGGGLPEHPEVDPPPGIWPPLTPEHPWRPIDPGWGQGRPLPPVPGQPLPRPPGLPPTVGGGPARPERPTDPGFGVDEGAGIGGGPVLPPGVIWPPLPPGVTGHYLALVVVFGMKGGPQYRYTVIDADLRPKPPMVRPPNYPDQGLPGGGDVAQPKQ